MQIKLILLLIITAPTLICWAGVDTLDKSALGTRQEALGGTGTAYTAKLSSLALNPAGLGLLTTAEFYTSAGDKYNNEVQILSLAGGMPLQGGMLAWQFSQESVSSIPETGDTPDKLGEFSFHDRSWRLAWGTAVLPDVLYTGLAVKLFNSELGAESATGWSLDVAILQKLSSNFWLGFNVRNIIPLEYTWSTGQTETLATELGVGLTYITELWQRSLLVSYDLDFLLDNKPATSALGAEYTLFSEASWALDLRAGYNRGQQVTLGIGLSFGQWQFDYAWLEHELGASNYVGLGFKLS